MPQEEQQWAQNARVHTLRASGAGASLENGRPPLRGLLCAFPSAPQIRAGMQAPSSSLVPKGQAVEWTLAVASTCFHDNHPQECHSSAPTEETRQVQRTYSAWGGGHSSTVDPPTHTPEIEWVPKAIGRQQGCLNQPRPRFFKSSKFRDHGYLKKKKKKVKVCKIKID